MLQNDAAAPAALQCAFKKAHEIRKLRPNLKTEGDVLQAIMSAPTFELHGIVGGYSGPGVKTIVPHQAEAKISWHAFNLEIVRNKADAAFTEGTKVKDALRKKLYPDQ